MSIQEVVQPPYSPLIDSSLAIIRRNQSPSGAFLACPSFPTYRYSWFRDGTFIANALDLWGDHHTARRFYDWGINIVCARADVVEAALTSQRGTVPTAYLHTRYTDDGLASDDKEWPNFQLDGFGTFLWGLIEHATMTEMSGLPPTWRAGVDLLAAYTGHLWTTPNYDCWEEFPDKVHISTLCTLGAGLRAVGTYTGDRTVAAKADEICTFIREAGARNGYLPKFIGSDAVDASLLWATVPFRLLEADDPLVQRTADKIASDLLGPYGGVHRYGADSYYGGGEWILLTALLGEYLLQSHKRDEAARMLAWIEGQMWETGDLPEQTAYSLNFPTAYGPWVERWGPSASPLLWSHAAYLRLKRLLVIERKT
ncbi:MAG: hypothetical protein NVSMB52_15060 [Chloroflexota bacterium]